MKILTIIGARPQFVKFSAFSLLLKKYNDIQNVILHTGQHYDPDMSDVFFKELDIKTPDINLKIGGGSHGQNTGRMIEKIECELENIEPDWVVVFGDTDSTLAGSIAASKLNIPVAHIEAGLRSFNRNMPEEINRILTDHCSELLFAPSKFAMMQLQKEGIDTERIVYTGDIMYDVVLNVNQYFSNAENVVRSFNLEPQKYVLATIHRAENTKDMSQLQSILNCLELMPYEVMLPLHPRTRDRLNTWGLKVPENIKVMPPVGYLDMFSLEKFARIIATDSGGVQKEAYFHEVPCITLRKETEWTELVEAGVNWIVGDEKAKVVDALKQIESDSIVFTKGIYGDGNAAEIILNHLFRY